MTKFNKMWNISWKKENGKKGYVRIAGISYEDVLAEFLNHAEENDFAGMPEDVNIEYDGYEKACIDEIA